MPTSRLPFTRRDATKGFGGDGVDESTRVTRNHHPMWVPSARRSPLLGDDLSQDVGRSWRRLILTHWRRNMAATNKPNILVIWGDDIGITNLSCYSRGLMGYRTPNIDRIAAEGMLFT